VKSKVCSLCKEDKAASLYANDTRHSDGLSSQCRRCQLDAKKVKRIQNKYKAVEYKGGCCNRCGQMFECLDVYDFHHRNPSEKEQSLNNLVNSNWNNIVKELDKCDLLCSNCHKITHWELRNIKETI